MRRRDAWMPLAAALWTEPAAAGDASADAQFDPIAARCFADRLELDPLAASVTLVDPRFEGRMEITIAPEQIAKVTALTRRCHGRNVIVRTTPAPD